VTTSAGTKFKCVQPLRNVLGTTCNIQRGTPDRVEEQGKQTAVTVKEEIRRYSSHYLKVGGVHPVAL
jgi:hypothetical protein